MNIAYKVLYGAGQSLRTRNYKLYRKIVENVLVRNTVQLLYGKKLIDVATSEGYALTINPIYHGNFLTMESIAQYEPEMRRLFESVVKPEMVVYDVGANVGIFSLQFYHLVGSEGQVYAFEPEDNNIRCLLNTKANNALSNLEALAKGVGERTETLFFDRCGGAMSGRLVDQGSRDNENVIEMQVVSVDDFVFSQGKRPPSLIKIDVEGNEVKVIEGARRTLKEHRPVIICELHPGIEPNVLDIHGILRGLGYQCFDVKEYTLNGKNMALESFVDVNHFIAHAP